MRIDVEKTTPTKVDERRLKKMIKGILNTEGRHDSDLAVVFVDDAEMRELNWRFRGEKGSTDVLAFSLVEHTPESHAVPDPLLGDVYVSVQQARRQAKQYGVTFSAETARLVAHGVLHLLGYEHQKKEEAKKMRKREDQILGKYLQIP